MIRQLSRQFHASLRHNKKYYDVVVSKAEAEKAIALPSSVSLKIHRIPPSAFPPQCPHGRFSYKELSDHKVELRRFRESSVYYKQMAESTAIVEVRGPMGVGYVPIPEWIDLAVANSSDGQNSVDIWHGKGAEGGNNDDRTRIYSLNEFLAVPEDNADRYLKVSCIDPEHCLQSRHWGFYKRRIERYVKNTVNPSVLPVRLVGVGYRAQVDNLALQGPEKGDSEAYQDFILSWQRQLNRSKLRQFIATNYPDSLWGQVSEMKFGLSHDINKHFTRVFERPVGQKPLDPPVNVTKKLVFKLGFSHNVDVMIPPFINVSLPSPTTILLSGIHPEKLEEFANLIRKWRKPEPYKGKGVFVGDETITLKSKKVK